MQVWPRGQNSLVLFWGELTLQLKMNNIRRSVLLGLTLISSLFVSCGETEASSLSMQMNAGYATAAYYTAYHRPGHSLQSGVGAQLAVNKQLEVSASIGASINRDSDNLYSLTPDSPSLGVSYLPSYLKFKIASISLSSGLTLKLDEASFDRTNYADMSLTASTGFKWSTFSVPLSLSAAKSFHKLQVSELGGTNVDYLWSLRSGVSYSGFKVVKISLQIGMTNRIDYESEVSGVFYNGLSLSGKISEKLSASAGIRRSSAIFSSNGSRNNFLDPIELDENSFFASLQWNII